METHDSAQKEAKERLKFVLEWNVNSRYSMPYIGEPKQIPTQVLLLTSMVNSLSKKQIFYYKSILSV